MKGMESCPRNLSGMRELSIHLSAYYFMDKADAKHREREAANEGELGTPSPASLCTC